MSSPILQRLLRKIDPADVPGSLVDRLKTSELTSLLLSVFAGKSRQQTAAQLLKEYERNRFVAPSGIDPLAFREMELSVLRAAVASGFEALECSPVCPLGTCSTVATVHQDKVLSAIRGLEVVADVTNVLALEISRRRRIAGREAPIHLCASHRHLRTQSFDLPGFTPHFQVISLVSGGRSSGERRFEEETLTSHLHFYRTLLCDRFGFSADDLFVELQLFDPAWRQSDWPTRLARELGPIPIRRKEREQEENEYYRGIRFKLYLRYRDLNLDIADGGLVDWSQQLLQDRKERMLISGLGTEFLYKLRRGEV